MPPTLSLVVPTHDGRENLPTLVRRVHRALTKKIWFGLSSALEQALVNAAIRAVDVVRSWKVRGMLALVAEKIANTTREVLERGQRLIPSYKPIGLVHGNVVAIGDAGFTVNPVTLGGIGPSVLAANLLAESLRRGEGLDAFEARYWATLGGKFEKLHRVNRVLRTGWLPLWWAVRAYYSNSALGRLIKRLFGL